MRKKPHWPPPSDPFWDDVPPKLKPKKKEKLSQEILDRLNRPEGQAAIARYLEACKKEKVDGLAELDAQGDRQSGKDDG